MKTFKGFVKEDVSIIEETSDNRDVKKQIESVLIPKLQAMIDKSLADSPIKVRVTATYGKKYAKIIRNSVPSGSEKSVHSFVDLTNGNILKAAGWKAPAKGVRGSVFDNNAGVGTAMGPYGAFRLR